MKLKRIQIKALRGLRDTELSLDGKSLVLFGENGSGKSSVVDGIEFLFTGVIRHLAGTQGLSFDRHSYHQGLSLDEMAVAATFDPGAIAVSRTVSSAPDVRQPLEDSWRRASSGEFILRRAQLLEFIHADPAERYRTIGSLIGIAHLDDIEVAMMRVRDDVVGREMDYDRRKADVEKQIGQLFEHSELTPDRALTSLNALAEMHNVRKIPSVKAIDTTARSWLLSVRAADKDLVSRLSSALTALRSVTVSEDVQRRAHALAARHAQLLGERGSLTRLAELRFLEEAQRLLTLRAEPTCPLCAQPFDAEGTLAALAARQQLLQELSEQFAQFRRDVSAMAAEFRLAATQMRSVVVAVPAEYLEQSTVQLIEDYVRDAQMAADAIESMRELNENLSFVLPSPSDKISAALNRARAALEAAIESQSDSPHDRAVLQLYDTALQLSNCTRTHEEVSAALVRTSEVRARAETVFRCFVDTKKARVLSVYEAIQECMRDYYGRIHHAEPFDGLELVLQEGRRASTQIRISQYGNKAIDPRALSSEGHLDSLGLCIFLSFARTFLEPLRLLVLDDVIMSVDARHRRRIAQLLIEEFEGWQLVITTHDEYWFEELMRQQDVEGARSRFSNRRILRWSFEEGPVLDAFVPRWDDIEAKLASRDKIGAANAGRQALEWILYELVTAFRVPVILRRDGKYTVGDLAPHAKGRLTKLVPPMEAEIAALFDAIERVQLPANYLSHENELAAAVTIDEVREFYEAVRALDTFWRCSGCGRPLDYVPVTREIRCTAKTCASQTRWQTSSS